MLESIIISLGLGICFFSIAFFKKNRASLSRYLFFLYGLSFILSFFLMIVSKEYNVALVPSLYLIFCLFLWIFPFDFAQLALPQKSKKNELKYLTWGILSSLFTIYFAYYAVKSILITPIEIARLVLTSDSILPPGPMTYGGTIFQSVYYINIILFFISIIKEYDAKISTLLLIGSMSNPFFVLCCFGRDGIVYWIMNMIGLFLFFSKYMEIEVKTKVIRIMAFFVILFMSILLFITYARFGKNNDNELSKMAYSILEYSGQQLGNFTDSFKYDVEIGSLIPQINRFLEKLGIARPNHNSYYSSTTGLEEETYVFGYFIKSMNFIIGKNKTIILAMLSFFIIVFLSLVSKEFYMFVIVYTIYQIPLCGLFYYRQAVSYFDISYIISVIASIFFIF